MSKMRIRHFHIPLTSYAHTSLLQSHLVDSLLATKSNIPPPPATILTFSCTPTYTTGRRDLNAITPSQTAYLSAPVTLPSPDGAPCPQHAKVIQSKRGGQTTFHGPGQLVAYAIMDLRSPALPNKKRPLRPKCYVDTLEEATIRTLAKWGVKGVRTDNPGVWIDEMRKIAALGVHVRSGITAHGVGLNVSTEMGWFERIVACGLEGKRTVNLEMMRGEAGATQGGGISVESVGRVWVEEFAKLVGGKAEKELMFEKELFEHRCEWDRYSKEKEQLLEEESRGYLSGGTGGVKTKGRNEYDAV